MLAPGLVIDIRRFDIRDQLQARPATPGLGRVHVPSVVLRRELDKEHRFPPAAAKLAPAEECLVLRERLGAEVGPGSWGLNREAEVLVPLYDYLLEDPAAEVLVHFGAQAGALALALLPAERRVTRIFLAVGNVFTRPDQRPGYQAWIGFAAIVAKE